MGVLRELYRRFLVARHCPAHWQLRQKTIDRRIFRRVVIDNEYRLSTFSAQDTILDIGAHTGSFALAALRQGAGTVVCCEPDPANFSLLASNLAPYTDRVRLLQTAVWRSDHRVSTLPLHNPVDRRNTGANQIALTGGVSVAAMSFDELVLGLTEDGRRLQLVKLDCEGAEWPILLTSRCLDRVESLCGEYHLIPDGGRGPFSVTDELPSETLLARTLQSQGFQVEILPLGNVPFQTGLFFARQTTCQSGIGLLVDR